MLKEELRAKVESAIDRAQLKSEQLFLFNLLEFEFSYDEEKKTCTIECPVSEPMLNPMGTVHGGIYTYICDSAIGHLHFHFKDAQYVSLELKTSYFQTTNSGKLTATARFIKEGNKVSFTECVVKNEKGEKMCVTTGTFYRLSTLKF